MSKNLKSQRTNINDPISHYTSLIRSLGRILKLPQNVIYTATHYVFKYVKLYDDENDDVAATAIFLASKAEEHPRKIRDCLNAYRYHKNLSTSTEDYDYADCKASFVAREQKLLRAIAFDCEVKSPYASCFLMASDLKCDSSVVHLAVALINDSVLLSVDRSTRTSTHAAACLHVASKLLSKPLPSSWWTPFNITTLEIREAVAKLSVIY